ncbi:MAG: YggT family protein [Dongiaceae bacterium]
MNPILWLLLTILDIAFWVVLISVILSWLINFQILNLRNQVVSRINYFFQSVTEPVLRPMRRYIPIIGGVDLTPLALLLIIKFIQMAIIHWFYF